MKYLMLILLEIPMMVQGHILKTDTLTTCELEEVTVVAATQQTLPDKTVYLPTIAQKVSASDGLSCWHGCIFLSLV